MRRAARGSAGSQDGARWSPRPSTPSAGSVIRLTFQTPPSRTATRASGTRAPPEECRRPVDLGLVGGDEPDQVDPDVGVAQDPVRRHDLARRPRRASAESSMQCQALLDAGAATEHGLEGLLHRAPRPPRSAGGTEAGAAAASDSPSPAPATSASAARDAFVADPRRPAPDQPRDALVRTEAEGAAAALEPQTEPGDGLRPAVRRWTPTVTAPTPRPPGVRARHPLSSCDDVPGGPVPSSRPSATSTWAATPSPSRMSPSRMCSVPM